MDIQKINDKLIYISYLALVTATASMYSIFRPNNIAVIKSGAISPRIMLSLHLILTFLNLFLFIKINKAGQEDIAQNNFSFIKTFYILNIIFAALYLTVLSIAYNPELKLSWIEYIIPATAIYVSLRLWTILRTNQ